MRVLSLFAGIGGMDLGLERAGMTVVGQCEIDPFCRRVLRKHWPRVWQHDDVRNLTGDMVREHCGPIDLICGGFPCQDISSSGKLAGIDGERSGLWSQIARLIGELRPDFALMENVAALLGRGLDRVLGDLASRGFDAEWECIPASALGAPHGRDRVWIVAYPEGVRRRSVFDQPRVLQAATADSARSAGACSVAARRKDAPWGVWTAEPAVDRVADGIPGRVDRLRGLGNAVVPQVAEYIGRKVMEAAHG